ncbi:hypothetical protein M23134_02440 [Microscilla marina ATCC 23134]|uniref:Uncharacterized protein n=1 Tax=Microscilla marina ATCC 23134 TaxID=313606 RepID=A1ZKM3_MICM2|nr:hypothetical protein M23134_00352 [Microscilla marina ATCC 23134]EAY29249.1 hypothetical protein M23134_02440 [Microscilla marina ATCC 23134]
MFTLLNTVNRTCELNEVNQYFILRLLTHFIFKRVSVLAYTNQLNSF